MVPKSFSALTVQELETLHFNEEQVKKDNPFKQLNQKKMNALSSNQAEQGVGDDLWRPHTFSSNVSLMESSLSGAANYLLKNDKN